MFLNKAAAPEKPKNKKKNQPKRALPLGGFIVLVVLFLSVLLACSVLFSFSLSIIKYQNEMNDAVRNMSSSIEKAEDDIQSVIDSYYGGIEKQVRLAEYLYKQGCFDSEPEKVQKTLDGQPYEIVTEQGDIIHNVGVVNLPKNILLECIQEFDSSDDVALCIFKKEELYIFMKKVSDDTYILTFQPVRSREEVEDYLYSINDMLVLDESYDSFYLLEQNGELIYEPEWMGGDGEKLISSFAGVPEHQKIVFKDIYLKVSFAESGVYFLAEQIERSESGYKLYYLHDAGRMIKQAFNMIGIVFLVTVLLILVNMFFGYVYQKSGRYETAQGRAEYRLKSKILAAASIVVVILMSYYVRTLYCMSDYVLDDNDELDVLEGIDKYTNEVAVTISNAYINEYKEEIDRIGAYLNAFPERRTEEELRVLSDMFELNYLILFDQDGSEICCDKGYINMKLADKKESPSYMLRPLLNGVPSIVTEAVTDDLTGQRVHLAGASLAKDGQRDGLILAGMTCKYTEAAVRRSSLLTLLNESVLSAINDYFVIDTESGILTCSPNHEYDGYKPEDAGFKEEMMVSGFSGRVRPEQIRYYVTARQIGKNLVYVAVDEEKVFGTRMIFVMGSALMAWIAIAVVMFLVRRTDIKPVMDAAGKMKTEAADAENSELMISQQWRPFGSDDQTPEERTTEMIFTVFRILGVIFMIMILFREHMFAEHSMIRYVMEGKWRPGLNVFALTGVLIFCLTMYIGVSILLGILRLASRIVSPHAETIVRLLRSAVEYISVLSAIYFSLKMFGMKVETLVTSAGIMALLVGMGAQDLTGDIIAGLFLMFEHEFDVGDVIEVGGKIGVVKEIGLHATKLIDSDNNVLILNNAKVVDVINRTRRGAYVFTVFMVPVDVSISQLEELFAEELPPLKEKHPEFSGIPFFKGVKPFKGGVMECTVAAEVEEKNRERMQHVLNAEVKEILEQHEITIG